MGSLGSTHRNDATELHLSLHAAGVGRTSQAPCLPVTPEAAASRRQLKGQARSQEGTCQKPKPRRMSPAWSRALRPCESLPCFHSVWTEQTWALLRQLPATFQSRQPQRLGPASTISLVSLELAPCCWSAVTSPIPQNYSTGSEPPGLPAPMPAALLHTPL